MTDSAATEMTEHLESVRRSTTRRRRVDARPHTADGTQHGFFSRLYTGTGGFEVIGRRKHVVLRSVA